MRLWSLHPKYLDRQGLVAVWREGLLAKKVLEGKTKGYRQHPQLERFKQQQEPLEAINQFLAGILAEARERGYSFDESKIEIKTVEDRIKVTQGQVEYEYRHLVRKLKTRDKGKYKTISELETIEAHPVFEVIEGERESWERSEN